MKRKEFLKTTGRVGLCAGSVALFGAPCGCFGQAGAAQSGPPVTPCEKKQEFTQEWVKRFFNVMDSNLDEKTRTKLMIANGKACHQASLGGRIIKPIPLEQLVSRLQQYGGKDSCRFDGQAIYFNYTKNPAGLKVSDGYCLCPMVESGPPGLSGTFCACSIGYVQDMFEGALGRAVNVELLESLKRGGKGCKFKVTLI